MKDSMIFYKSFIDALNELPDEDRLKLYDAIFAFGIYGTEPELSGIDAAVFTLVRPQIEANNRKYENGVKGGRPKNQTETKTKPNHNQTITKSKPNNNLTETKQKPNQNQSITKPKPNVNVNVNDNDNDNENGNDNVSGFDGRNTDGISLSLLSFLNSETGATYTETEQFDNLVNGILNDGYTVDDIKTVIHKKAHEWSCDGKMRPMLRPSVLLGERFEEYLNAPDLIEVEQERETTKKFEQLQAERDKKSSELKRITNRILQIGGVNMLDNYDEYEDLKLKAAVLEQEIDSLDARLQREAVS